MILEFGHRKFYEWNINIGFSENGIYVTLLEFLNSKGEFKFRAN
jgi:hypothetical protein